MTEAAPTPHCTAQTRLLVVAPHPDDETIATGMLIQRVRAAGGVVDILLLTDGDNNPWPQRLLERRLHIGAAGRVRWGHRRRAEMAQAMQHLGVAAEHLHPFGWPDLGLAELLLQPDSIAVQTVASLLAQLRPNLLVMPALADRHPDHASAHVLLRLALAGAVDPPAQWTYAVHAMTTNASPIESGGTPAQRANKQAALAAHASQMLLSGSRLRRLATRGEQYLPLSTGCGTGDVLPWRPPAWLGPRLRLSVVDVRGARSWRWSRAPVRRDEQGVTHLLASVDHAAPCFARLALQVPSPWIFDHWGWCEFG